MRASKTKEQKPKAKAQKATKNITVGQVNITASELLDMFTGNITLLIGDASANELAAHLMDSSGYSEIYQKTLQEKVGVLLGGLGDVRTAHCVSEVTLVAEQHSEYDDHWLQLKLVAKTDPNKGPDLPEITGKQAKELLEFFGEFPLRIELDENDDVIYSPMVDLYTTGGAVPKPIPAVAPCRDVKQLYINVVHSVFGALLGGGVAGIRMGDEPAVCFEDWHDQLAHIKQQARKRKKK